MQQKSNNPTIKNIVKQLRDNPLLSTHELECSREVLYFAKSVLEAENFVEAFKEAGNKYLCTRLRPGYIGQKVCVPGGASYIQSERGKPFGSVVSIPNKNGTVSIGISYTDNEPKDNPYAVVGLATALKQAIDARDNNEELVDITSVRPYAREQVEYFVKRSLAYFNPEVYSYSRGQEDKKVTYDNYDEIHNRRELILGVEKVASITPKNKNK